MLHHINTIVGLKLQARDGDIGKVVDLLFDDEAWTVRYLVVAPDGWLSDHEVLISPISVRGIDWKDQRVDVDLTREQVEHSPDISSNPPISRQREAAYHAYYGYPLYWGGTGIWGPGMYPDALLTPVPPDPVLDQSGVANGEDASEQGDPHLRSTREVTGYGVQASDGHIGHIADFLIDLQTWSLRYLLIDTRNWWPGKHVLIAPSWVKEISWEGRDVVVPQTRDTIKGAPEFTDAAGVDQAYEEQLRAYYGHAS